MTKVGRPKANNKGVPRDEMMLAKMIQNAKALGLKRTRDANYRSADGEACYGFDNATSCCAIGAALITNLSVGIWADDGNDGAPPDDQHLDGYDVGRSWYHAMGR